MTSVPLESSTELEPGLSPLPASVAQRLEAIRSFAPSDGRSQFQVLVVDDDPMNVQVLTERLQRGNYAIAQASSGQEAPR